MANTQIRGGNQKWNSHNLATVASCCLANDVHSVTSKDLSTHGTMFNGLLRSVCQVIGSLHRDVYEMGSQLILNT